MSKMEKKHYAQETALRYLSYSDKTSMEIQEYLKKKDFTDREIAETMRYLTDMHYIDDEEYVKKYVEYAGAKGQGSMKIKNELKKKGISGELIEGLAEEECFSKENQRQQALTLAEKFRLEIGSLPFPEEGDSYETKREKYKELQRMRAKLGRRLAGKGYSQEVIFFAIDSVFDK